MVPRQRRWCPQESTCAGAVCQTRRTGDAACAGHVLVALGAGGRTMPSPASGVESRAAGLVDGEGGGPEGLRVVRRGQAEVLPGEARGGAPAWGADHEALAHEVGLGD